MAKLNHFQKHLTQSDFKNRFQTEIERHILRKPVSKHLFFKSGFKLVLKFYASKPPLKKPLSDGTFKASKLWRN